LLFLPTNAISLKEKCPKVRVKKLLNATMCFLRRLVLKLDSIFNNFLKKLQLNYQKSINQLQDKSHQIHRRPSVKKSQDNNRILFWANQKNQLLEGRSQRGAAES
jgi:hypothetical protein